MHYDSYSMLHASLQKKSSAFIIAACFHLSSHAQNTDVCGQHLINLIQSQATAHHISTQQKQNIYSKKPVSIFWGIDPSFHSLHIGHIPYLYTLKVFANCHHHIKVSVGNVFAEYGDPTGYATTRKRLSQDTVAYNRSLILK